MAKYGDVTQFFHLLRETPFSGREDEDANQHVEDIVDIVDFFNASGVEKEKDAVLLRVFPITLKGAAKIWFNSETSTSIGTWEQLKTKFIKQFTPLSKIAMLEKKIWNFQQYDDESLYDAWNRYKEMLKNCPQHDLKDYQIVQIFYDGINMATRMIVNSRGLILGKTPTIGYTTIEELAQHSYHWYSSWDSSIGKRHTRHTRDVVDSLSTIIEKLDALGRDMEKVKQTIHAIQVGCDSCSGPHLAKDCPLDEGGNKKVEVCYSFEQY